MRARAKKLADALTGWDETSRTLIRAARCIERTPGHMWSGSVRISLQALWDVCGRSNKEVYAACTDRLFDATGLDQMDLSPEEAIDNLVASAFWEV